MVDEIMAGDLLAFGRPVLCVGDPGQLPPIKGEKAPFVATHPDAMLTEIHRQARGSLIIRAATAAREGRVIPHGDFGVVRKVPPHRLSAEELLAADQVIVGTHTRRRELNNQMRAAAGFTASLPSGDDEKIICLRNQHGLGLFNGQFLALAECNGAGRLSFEAEITTEDGDNVGPQLVYRGYFDDHIEFDREREQRDAWDRRRLIEADWGYAITAHKAQGSGWPAVVVFDDGFGSWKSDGGKLARQWLYTACSRATERLTIVA
jgi:exodeoxyribonuclease-5